MGTAETKRPRGRPPGAVPDPSSLSGLLRIWEARDNRYAMRKWPLRPEELAMIRAWRSDEALDVVPVGDISAAVTEARRWVPPTMILRDRLR